MYKTILVTLLSCFLLVGCDDKKGSGGSEGSAESGGGGATTVELAKLGLKADAPSGSKVSDAPIGEGVMIQGPNLVVTIELASDTRPKTVEEAKEDADMYSPKNMKTEKLADGWAMTFENKGSMGANYFVKVRRDIGGKTYWCETTSSNVDQQKNALAACKSLKK